MFTGGTSGPTSPQAIMPPSDVPHASKGAVDLFLHLAGRRERHHVPVVDIGAEGDLAAYVSRAARSLI